VRFQRAVLDVLGGEDVLEDEIRFAEPLLAAGVGARDAALRKLDGGLSERRAIDAWAADGVTPADPLAGPVDDPVGLLLLEETADGVDGASYWIACNNFYVLTRYNRSRLYAAAVHALATAIKASRDEVPR
jgi:membrane-bound lytic murein transglycosylase B